MRFDVSKKVPIYQPGKFLQDLVDDPEHKDPDTKPKRVLVDTTLGKILETVLINAPPTEHKSTEDRVKVYKILQKVHAADPILELKPEDVVLIKKIIGTGMYPIVMVGAMCEVLDSGNADPVAPIVPEPSREPKDAASVPS